MIGHLLKTAFRNLRRHKAQAAINILGLSIGLACSFLIVLWVQDELKYDDFHQNEDRLFRVLANHTTGDRTWTQPSVPKPLDDVLDEEYPEITNSVLMSSEWNVVFSKDDRIYRADGRYFGPDLFKVFTFPLITGDSATALTNPESIAISSSMAEKLYGMDWRGRDDVLGSILQVNYRRDAVVTGVFEDPPLNSSLRFDFAFPIERFNHYNPWIEDWDNNAHSLFVRLADGADHNAVSAKIRDLVDQHVSAYDTDLFLQPLSDWYLRSDYENGVLVGGRIEYVHIFLFVALFMILIASINFMNLATARSEQRAKEIGVRKSAGASKSILARQFLGESVLMAVISFAIAALIVIALIPTFSALTDKSVSAALLEPKLWIAFASTALVTGLLAGSYPAFHLSSFSVAGVLRGQISKSGRAGSLRKGLVVLQFILSIVLIVGTFTVHEQLGYIRSKDLGLDRENVVFLGFEGAVRGSFETFKTELLKKPGIVAVAVSNQSPMSVVNSTIGVEWDGKDPDDHTSYSLIDSNEDFIETLGIQLKEGRPFSPEMGADSTNYIINETAAKRMGITDPVGKRLAVWEREGSIVGVVRDFHMRSLYEPIEPVVFRWQPRNTSLIFVRLGAGMTSEGLASLESTLEEFNPGYPLDYRFMDADFEETYRSEAVIGSLSDFFAAVAILIACLGLLGLASFSVERRTKEIGVRKVLGASVASVVALLSREVLVLVGAAFVVAAPLSYYLMQDWLSAFTFHTEFGGGTLIVAGAAAMLISWLTVSCQSIRAASADPVVALRSE